MASDNQRLDPPNLTPREEITPGLLRETLGAQWESPLLGRIPIISFFLTLFLTYILSRRIQKEKVWGKEWSDWVDRSNLTERWFLAEKPGEPAFFRTLLEGPKGEISWRVRIGKKLWPT